MTLKEQLFQDLDKAPGPILERVFNFLHSLTPPEQSASMPNHPLANLSDEERLAKINAVLGAWKDDPEIDEIFTQIDHDRHAYRGRQTDSMDN